MRNAKFTSLLSPGEKVTGEQLETDRQILAFDRAIQGLSRRRFMGGLTGAAALAAAAGFVEMPKAFAQSTAPSIPTVLNFALNLEYLEANFYYFAAYGTPIPASVMGSAPGAITGTSTALTAAVQASPTTLALAKALAQDELNHIADLQSAITSLGSTPISQPALNYAPASKGMVTTVPQFLATARQFTALGNSAYAGAAQYLVSNPSVLTVAAQILGAEGQHLGAVNYQCITQNVTTAFSTNSAAYLDEQDQPPSPTQYFTVALAGNAAGIPAGFGIARNTSQDLGVVYGISTPSTLNPPTGVTSGGFFPNGVNGTITCT